MGVEAAKPGLLSVARLEANTGGDVTIAEEVLGLFRQQTEIWMRFLNVESPQASWADAAHTLKGAALGIGAEAFAVQCSALETLGRRDVPASLAEAGVAIAAVKDSLAPTLEAVAALEHHLAVTGAFPASNTSNS